MNLKWRAALAGVTVLGLSACGNDPGAGMLGGLPIKALAQATLAQVGIGKAATPAATPAEPDPAQVAESRRMLEAAGVPLYIIQNKSLGIVAYFGILGQNGDVVTWSTPDYVAVSLRDGMVVSTRGFGSDIMSSAGPSTAEIMQGTGSTQRSYFYLDASDQTQRFDFACTLAVTEGETITLIGKDYPTRRVDEACSGEQGSFVNSYWFDVEAKLRQSSQLLAPGIENLLVRRIID